MIRNIRPAFLDCRAAFLATALFASLFAILTPEAQEQVIDLAAQREHLSAIDRNWRFHTGDDVHRADPVSHSRYPLHLAAYRHADTSTLVSPSINGVRRSGLGGPAYAGGVGQRQIR